MSANKYADNPAQPFETHAVLPDEVADAYMTMQARIFNDFSEHVQSQVGATYTQPKESFVDAYAAGFEMAHRLSAHNMTHDAEYAIANRNLTGIMYATGVVAVAFKAGVQAWEAQNI